MDGEKQLQRRRIGRTGLEVTALGLGSASLAGNMTAVEDSDASGVIFHAQAVGIDFFDTAPFYGFGRAERLMGDALRANRDNVTLSTKVGRLLKPHFGAHPEKYDWRGPLPFIEVFDYSYDGIMRSFEDSLQRLGLNRVDVLLVHDIGTVTHGEGNAAHWRTFSESGYRAMRELRDGGTVGAIGLGVNEWEVLMDALALGDWDVFLLAGRYTLLEQTSLSPFLTTCTERGASIIVGGPFNSGILVGGDTWNYAKAPEDVVTRVQSLKAACEEFGVNMPAAALQFPLAHDAVCNVLPGPRTPIELDQIVAWWWEEIPAEFWQALVDRRLVAEGTPLPGGITA